MIEEIEICISDLLNIVRKGDDKTLKEQKQLDNDLKDLNRIEYIISPIQRKLNNDQLKFIRKHSSIMYKT